MCPSTDRPSSQCEVPRLPVSDNAYITRPWLTPPNKHHVHESARVQPCLTHSVNVKSMDWGMFIYPRCLLYTCLMDTFIALLFIHCCFRDSRPSACVASTGMGVSWCVVRKNNVHGNNYIYVVVNVYCLTVIRLQLQHAFTL